MTREEIKGRATNAESGWAIEWNCEEGLWSEDHPIGISFTIFGSNNDGEAVWRGRIKWDGCSDWDDPKDGYCPSFHFCGEHDVAALNSSLMMCYEIAGKYMPEAVSP